MEENITIELGYNGDDFVKNSITCAVRSPNTRFSFTVAGFYKYAPEVRAKLIIYKTLKKFCRLHDYKDAVSRFKAFSIINHAFLKF